VTGTVGNRDSPGDPSDRYEAVVVGCGQAGLAIGYFLARQGRRFRILEASDAPAGAWRARWDSLRLFTPVRYDSLPGRAFPGDPHTYPRRRPRSRRRRPAGGRGAERNHERCLLCTSSTWPR
jgi:cation diffusion facilitator CzcD-associated flavoprotein CzcO